MKVWSIVFFAVFSLTSCGQQEFINEKLSQSLTKTASLSVQKQRKRYIELIKKIKQSNNPNKFALELITNFKNSSKSFIKQDAMQKKERMQSIKVENITIYWGGEDQVVVSTIITIIKGKAIIPKFIAKYTKTITITTQKGDGIATSGDNDGNITIYAYNKMDLVTLAHEMAHNYADVHFAGYNKIEESPWVDIMEEEKSPYTLGGIEDDFAESVALYILDKHAFSSKYPKRTLFIEKYIFNAKKDSVLNKLFL